MSLTRIAAAAGSLAILAAGLGVGTASASTDATARPVSRVAFCDQERNEWAPACRGHEQWRHGRDGHVEHWSFNDRDHRWHRR